MKPCREDKVGGGSRLSKRPFRVKQQMAEEEAAWHALMFIQVHKERKRPKARATPMHKQ